MNKEEYRKAFNAGKEYWQWVQTDEPMLHKPIDFDEWYDTVVLPQANVISCVCPNEIKTGTVAIHCCNLCGKPDEDWWGKH